MNNKIYSIILYMSHLQQLQYYSLKDFIDLTSMGKIGPSMYLDLRNMNGNEIHIEFHIMITVNIYVNRRY